MVEKQIKRHSLNTSTLIRVGDRLECIPGFKCMVNYYNDGYPVCDAIEIDPNYGGAGYKPGKIFISDMEFTLSNDDEVFFPSNSPYGVFHKVLRKI